MEWQPIETAPKDGQIIILLSRAHTLPATEWTEKVHCPAKASLGRWWEDENTTAWRDENGLYPQDPGVNEDTIGLYQSGIWASGSGWFEPGEVTHWMPIPDPP